MHQLRASTTATETTAVRDTVHLQQKFFEPVASESPQLPQNFGLAAEPILRRRGNELVSIAQEGSTRDETYLRERPVLEALPFGGLHTT